MILHSHLSAKRGTDSAKQLLTMGVLQALVYTGLLSWKPSVTGSSEIDRERDVAQW